jgi:hypothetical protein
MAATATSYALKLGFISQTHFRTAVPQAIDIRPMYMNRNSVDCKFIKLICECVNQKSAKKIKTVVRQVYRVDCQKRALSVGLNPPEKFE